MLDLKTNGLPEQDLWKVTICSQVQHHEPVLEARPREEAYFLRTIALIPRPAQTLQATHQEPLPGNHCIINIPVTFLSPSLLNNLIYSCPAGKSVFSFKQLPIYNKLFAIDASLSMFKFLSEVLVLCCWHLL